MLLAAVNHLSKTNNTIINAVICDCDYIINLISLFKKQIKLEY